MIYVAITAGGTTWYVSEYTHTNGAYLYDGRLLNSVKLLQQFTEAGTATPSVDLQIQNSDRWISGELWGAQVEVTLPSGLSWFGKISAFDHDGNGILYVSGNDIGAPELDLLLPDEIAHVFDVADLHTSTTDYCIPLAFGGTAANPLFVKGILISKSTFTYLFSVGDIRAISKVYNGTSEITTGFTAYTGTSGQAIYPGFACVQFASDPRNDDGTWPDIYADIVGLKLGTHTESECRNPARILQYLLTTARTGVNGWGLGVDSGDLDATSFSTAITDCDTYGFHIDGLITNKQQARYWVDQITRSCRGSYFTLNGKRYLTIAKPGTSAQTYDLTNMIVDRIGKGNSSNRRNKVVIDYRYNAITQGFTANETRTDSTSINLINEQAFNGQLQLVSEQATAGAIADYELKRSQYGESRIYFATQTPTQPGEVITIDRPDIGLNNALYRVVALETGTDDYKIDAASYSDSIFAISTPGTAPSPVTQDLPVASAYPPATASGLSLTSGVETYLDGTVIAYIDGTFTLPVGAYLGALVQWGIGANPASWTTLGSIKGNQFRLSPVIHGQTYTIKVTAINAAGQSPSITGTIIASVDTTAPEVPTITAAQGLHCITLTIGLSFVHPQFSHYVIQRKKADDSDEHVIDSRFVKNLYVDNDPLIIADYNTSYRYSVKAVTRSGVESVYSAYTTAIAPITASTKDIAAGAITSDLLTANQIIGKDIRTASNAGDGVSGVRLNSTGISGWDGSTNNFCLSATNGYLTAVNANITGTITANAGYIGLWSIIDGYLQGGSGATTVGIDSCARGGVTIWAGGDTPASAPYRLYNDGRAHLTMGCIGAWEIGASTLTGGNLTLSSNGSIYSCDFASGLRGWRVDGSGDAEFNNLAVRGEIRSSVFAYDSVSTIGGQLLVAAGGNLFADWTTPTINSCNDLCITGAVQLFATDDIIRAKTGTNEAWAKVINAVNCTDYYLYTVQLLSGSVSVLIPAGTAVANYGQATASSGAILLNGQGTSSPYIDVFTNGTTPWTGLTPRVRLGALAGIAGQSGYGLWTDNGNITGGVIRSNNWGTSAGSCFDLTGGCFTLGGSSAPALSWNGSTLAVTGAITATSGTFSGTVNASAGCIGGWCLASSYMTSGVCSTYAAVSLYAAYQCYPMIEAWVCLGTYKRYINMGRIYSGSYRNLWGFGTDGGTGGYFWAGHTFGDVTLPDGATVACGATLFYVGDASSYVKFDSISDKLSIRGDVEVLSTGNILPDPDFRCVPYHCDYTLIPLASYVGGWYVAGSGGVAYASHRQNISRGALLYPGSNSIWLYATSVSNYATISSEFFPVIGGTTYIVSTYAASHPGYTCPRGIYCVLYYNSAGTCVGGTAIFDTCAIPATATRFYASSTAPATAAKAQLIGYNYHPSGASYLYFSALQMEEKVNATQTLPTSWKIGERGSITAGKIFGGSLTSTNWSTTAGSCFDLTGGCFALGGSSAPALSWNGSALSVSGTICSTAGNIGGWVIQSDNLRYTGCWCGYTAGIQMYPSTPVIYTYAQNSTNSAYVFMGKTYDAGGWRCGVGYTVTNGYTGRPAFAAGMTIGTDTCLPDSGTALATGEAYFWVGDSTSYLRWYNGLLTLNGAFSIKRTASDISAPWICLSNTCVSTNCFGMATFLSQANAPLFVCSAKCLSVYACATINYAVYGQAAGAAIYGNSTGSIGVYGYAATCQGVYGQAAACHGVCGYAGVAYPVSGNGAYYSTSTRALKMGFEDVEVLAGLRCLCIQKWVWQDGNQKTFDQFISPVAEDVQSVFGLTFANDGIYQLDGLALKAAQEIDRNVSALEALVAAQQTCINDLSARLAAVESKLAA